MRARLSPKRLLWTLKKDETIFPSRSDRALTLKHVLLKGVRSHLLVQRVGTQPEWRQSLKQISMCGGPVTTFVAISIRFHIWKLLGNMAKMWSWSNLCWMPLETSCGQGIFIMINLLKPANHRVFEGQVGEEMTAHLSVNLLISLVTFVMALQTAYYKRFCLFVWLFFPNNVVSVGNRRICF